jgi:hypothetical protein
MIQAPQKPTLLYDSELDLAAERLRATLGRLEEFVEAQFEQDMLPAMDPWVPDDEELALRVVSL